MLFSFFSMRSLTASNALYGFAQIFALRQLLFLDMKTREHDLLSRRLFSPTNYTNFTPLFSLKRLFLPQIAQITQIHFSFFSIRSLTASNALYGFAQIFALRQLLFLDMKTREHNLSHGNYFLSRNARNFYIKLTLIY